MKTREDKYKEIYDILGDSPDDMNKELEEWLNKDPENLEAYNEFKEITSKAGELAPFFEMDKNETWAKIESSTKSKHIVFWRYAAAAVVLALIGSQFLFNEALKNRLFKKQHEIIPLLATELVMKSGESFNISELSEDTTINIGKALYLQKKENSVTIISETKGQEYYDIASLKVPRGKTYTVNLSDGSSISLNAESSLTFKNNEGNNDRVIALSGEGYFEVEKVKDSRFVVNTFSQKIEVLGTRFNVRSYESDVYEEVGLIEGSLSVNFQNNIELLVPGQKLIINHDESNYLIEQSNEIASWRDGILRFSDIPLEELTHSLSRWYNIDFTFENNEIRRVTVSGVANLNNPVDELLSALEKSVNISWKLEENQISFFR